MSDRITLRFGTFQRYPDYVIGEARYGAHLDESCLKRFAATIASQYTHPFGFISNRVNDHSRDITLYTMVNALMPHLVCMAIVSYDASSHVNLALEHRMAANRLPIKAFDTLDEAIAWTREQVEATASTAGASPADAAGADAVTE